MSAVRLGAFVLLVGLLSGSRTHLVAQERLPSLRQGERVRITSGVLPTRRVLIFEGFRADTLLAVRRSGDSMGFPLSQIHKLETARKDRLTGALIGAPVGALAVTAVLGIWAHSQGGWMCCGNSWGNNFRFSAIFGVPIGGVAGAITGGVVGVERWRPVPGFTGRR